MNQQAVSFKIEVERSTMHPKKWYYSRYYIDIINGIEVCRKYASFVSGYFNTRKEALSNSKTLNK